jgi:[ribosomal protein S5]-alanine N-acetyltransferase
MFAMKAPNADLPRVERVAQEPLARGPSLSLRYPELRDAPALFALATDPEVTRLFSWGPYEDPRETLAWLGTLPQRRARGIPLELAVVDEADQPIGIMLLSEIGRRDRRAIVGTWLGRAYWGTGANRETKALMAHLAFGRLELDRLGAYADVLNTRSQAALERLGFKREGVLHAFHRHYDTPRDVALYALLRRDWERGELARVPAQLGGSLPDTLTKPVVPTLEGLSWLLKD